MGYLLFIFVTLVLAVGFYILTEREAASGVRVMAARRDALDAWVGRMVFIATHVDFNAFAREELRSLVGRAGHAIAHLSLQLVRAVERLLTRVVRRLRVEHAIVPAAGSATTREFVKTLSDFKGRLKDTMPEVAPVQHQE